MAELEQTEFEVLNIDVLNALGRVLVRATSPNGMTLPTAQAIILDVDPDAIVAHNHIYGTGQGQTLGRSPQDLLNVHQSGYSGAPRIGVIDTAIDMSHPALQTASLETRDFVAHDPSSRPRTHGTTIVSILVGQDQRYGGLVPDAEIYAASVFFDTAQSGDMATTYGLAQAVDWMIENEVQVINFSLTGPDNSILREAIGRARARGILAVAAIGNDGPGAPPRYPAAYEDVVGVTAVSYRQQIYRLAGQGPHVDFAAPGVLVAHASPGGDYGVSSGTSLATPFVSAVLALLIDEGALPADAVLQLQTHAEDLGEEGFDPVFGYGFIRVPD